ncbi:hypothetical protein CDAR_472271 [Caerostris darwini]|uniref:Uncharacterized protein n=1 Tax=Caerostris darwini TaxID=1538125 RepID=A0AAV4VNJ0_9ARAC|nr:hypothetical protein CDAR_472271 [Caerostris darwini]
MWKRFVSIGHSLKNKLLSVGAKKCFKLCVQYFHMCRILNLLHMRPKIKINRLYGFPKVNQPQKVYARSPMKQMVTCLSRLNGHGATIPLENYRTIHSEWYSRILFAKVFGEMCKNNQQCKIILSHDKVRSRKSGQTT